MIGANVVQFPDREARARGVTRPAAKAIAAALCVAGALIATGASAQSQAYPTRPVKMFNSLGAGSSGDRLNRQLADALSQKLKQQILVENRPGASGAIAAQAAAKSAPDGYTLFMGSTASLAILMSQQPEKIGFDLRKDFAPVTKVAQIPNGVIVTNTLGADSVAALVKIVKARPGQLTCASTGVGGLLHLTCELFKQVAGVDLLHVPYKGATDFQADLIEGRVAVTFDNIPIYVPLAEAGKVRILAVTSPKRAVALPNVPTTAELGMPRVESVGLFGLFAPARTPDAVIALLARESADALRQPALRDSLLKQGIEADPSAPQGLRDQVETEITKWGRLIREGNIPLQ